MTTIPYEDMNIPNEFLIEYISKKKERLLNLKKELLDVAVSMC